MKRPFVGLRREPPRDRYDVVVVGSGIGGLITAVMLAQAGRSVLLVEQHYMAGGYCSTFRRAGFTFDAATHFYPLLGNPQTVTGRLLASLGCRTEWVRMDPVDTFHFPDGSRFVVAADFERYRSDVEAAFPHQVTQLQAFFDAARQAYADGLVRYFRGHETERSARWVEWTLADALAHFIDDPKLRLLLAADCAHWGSPPARTSFVFDSMLRFSYFLGNYFPVGGSQAFTDELARLLEAAGGHVLMSTTCERIVVEDGRVAGVELQTSRGALAGPHRVATSTVVSNADLRQTLERMLPAEVVAPHLRAELDRLRLTYPCFLTHLGLEGVDSADLERAQGYYWSSWDAERVGSDGLRCKVFVPTLYEPDLAPPGCHIVILQKVLDEPAVAQLPWGASKQTIEDYLVAQLEAVLPGVQAKIITRSSASAWTSERFTLNRGGAMLGWEMAPDQLGSRRPARDGIVPGLHLVGHWTRPGGGVTPVIISATELARELLVLPGG